MSTRRTVVLLLASLVSTLDAFVQFNSTTNRLDANVRLRYAVAEGTDLWVVYNEGLDTSRSTDHVTPGYESRFSLARTLIVKYSHTFAF